MKTRWSRKITSLLQAIEYNAVYVIFLMAVIVAIAIGILLAKILPLVVIILLMIVALVVAVIVLSNIESVSTIELASGIISLILIYIFYIFTDWGF